MKLQDLGLLLKNIGCFRPRPSLTPSVVRPRSSAATTSPSGSSVPLSSPMGEQPSQPMTAAAALPPENTIEDEDHAITGDVAGPEQDETAAAQGDKNVTFRACPADSAVSDSDHETSLDFRQVENQVQEGLESLEFHLAVLQRSVDQAHINMRIASQEFASLLKKVQTIHIVV